MTGHDRVEPAFDGVVQDWLGTLPSANTRAAYRADLGTFGRWCVEQGAIPLRVDTATLAAFHAAQEAAGASVATRRRRMSSLSSFFQYALATEAVDRNPARGGDRPRLEADEASPTVALSTATVEDYLAVAARLDPRLDALVSLLVFDGLKLGEALALDVDDVGGRPPRVTVHLRRRGAVERIDLAGRSSRAVYRCAGDRAGEPLFVSRAANGPSRRLTRFGADHLFKQLDPDGAVAPTANALRRYHVSARHAAGADLDEVRHGAGVTDVRTIRRLLPGGDGIGTGS